MRSYRWQWSQVSEAKARVHPQLLCSLLLWGGVLTSTEQIPYQEQSKETIMVHTVTNRTQRTIPRR